MLVYGCYLLPALQFHAMDGHLNPIFNRINQSTIFITDNAWVSTAYKNARPMIIPTAIAPTFYKESSGGQIDLYWLTGVPLT